MREKIRSAFRGCSFEVFAQNPGLYLLACSGKVQDTCFTKLHTQTHLTSLSRLFCLHDVDDRQHPIINQRSEYSITLILAS